MNIDFSKEYMYSDCKNGVLLGVCFSADDYNYYDSASNKVSNDNGFKIVKKNGGGLFRRIRRSIEKDTVLKDNPFCKLHL